MTNNEEMKRYIGVLVEEFNARVAMIGEGMDSMRDELLRKISETARELKEEIVVTQLAVKDNRQAIKRNSEGIIQNGEAIHGNSEGIQGLKSEMHNMEQRLTTKIEQIYIRLDGHDLAIARLLSNN